MTSVGGSADGFAADGSSLGTQPTGWTSVTDTRARAAHLHGTVTDLFARSIYNYARQHEGEPIKLLQVGCTGPADELELDKLRAHGVDVSVRRIEQDHPESRDAVRAADASPGAIVFGDLRSIPLPTRDIGVVYCAHLLDRVQHAELVLDRLVAALKPGGMLLLRFRDRECAAGVLDRMLPQTARRVIWHWLRPEQAGPLPAVYEPLLSAEGVYGYTLARGLVIGERQAVHDRPPRPDRPTWGAPLACRLIATLSRGRHPDDHDDLLYVIRKPVNRFARVL
jgi:SAM-dependent methyltransferase